MEQGILITSLGHSCFIIEADGVRLVLDPYQDGSVDGLPPIREEAEAVLCSHGHHDHNNRDAVTLTGKDPWQVFRLEELSCPHDGENGTKRGMNTIHVLEARGLRVAHMGDIGTVLSVEECAKLGKLDAVLVPVGGFFTIDAEEAHLLMERLAPRVIIPMHYKTSAEGFAPISTVEPFLAHCANVKHYPDHRLLLTTETEAQTAVLR